MTDTLDLQLDVPATVSANVASSSNAPKPRKGRRGSAPGERRGGRSKGTPNKFNGDMKAAIVEAFHKAGGVSYLVKVAHDNPAVFCGLVGKVLPLQVTGAGGGPIRIAWTDSDDEQRTLTIEHDPDKA